jgi:glycerate 2-kinase
VTHRIRNYDELASTPARRDVLDIIESGLAAIDTGAVVRKHVQVNGNRLIIGTLQYDLNAYRHIHVLGFGKASCAAASVLDELLGERLFHGIALGSEAKVCRTIDVCEATHPLPSERNLELSSRLVRECETITADDLVLVIVSGGGSAMLCWPASECEQGVGLYEASVRKGLTIEELNTARKHISSLKGGGLAKLLHPATVVGLIFSDVPGNAPDMVASGPTYPDSSTVADAQSVIDRHDLGSYQLQETPKDMTLFKNVSNIVMVSNSTALDAMSTKSRSLGYAVQVIASDMYDEPDALVNRFSAAATAHSVVLGGGESRMVIPESGGMGGRNQHVALTAAMQLRRGQLFASIASDGSDNGDGAGALVDDATVRRASESGLDAAAVLLRFDEHMLLDTVGAIVLTGLTGANVSDLMVLLTP